MASVGGAGMNAVGQRLSELTVTARGGRRLRGRWWRRDRPAGAVVVSHGFGEHGGLYDHVARALGEALELDVIAHDFHGHGRSPGRRGVVRRYEDLVDDLRAVASWARLRFARAPLFLLGHSNGGQVALRLALDDRPPVLDGVIVSNPFIRLAMRVPAYKLALGRLLLRVAPGATLRAFDPSRVEARDRAAYRDDLRHNRINAPFFFGMVDGGELLLRRAGDLRTPLLTLAGGEDPIVEPASVREFFDRAGSEDKTLMLYPGMSHEPLNEPGGARVIADVVRWLAPRLDPEATRVV